MNRLSFPVVDIININFVYLSTIEITRAIILPLEIVHFRPKKKWIDLSQCKWSILAPGMRSEVSILISPLRYSTHSDIKESK